MLLYAKVVDQDNVNDLLNAFRYDEDKEDFLARVRASVSSANLFVTKWRKADWDVDVVRRQISGVRRPRRSPRAISATLYIWKRKPGKKPRRHQTLKRWLAFIRM